jgi:uncharacterized membrane protein
VLFRSWLSKQTITPELKALVEAHQAFHRKAGEVVTTARTNRAAALALLNSDVFSSTTAKVMKALGVARDSEVNGRSPAPHGAATTAPRGDDPNVWDHF